MLSNKPNELKLELSIIILSYNTKKLTVETIESVYKSTNLKISQFEIIVIDNNSTDDSALAVLELVKKYKNLQFIQSNINLGYSKGNNLAAKKAIGTYLLFLNSDIVVHRNAIDKLLEFSKQQKNDFFAGGKLLNSDGTPQPSCGPFYTLFIIFGALFLRGDYWGLTRSSPNKNKYIDWVSGACLITKKETFEKLRGFDEGIFMYMEEIDLLYRARLLKIYTHFIADAVFTHLGSASSNGKSYPIQQVFSGFTYFYKKHYSVISIYTLYVMLQLKVLIVIIIGFLIKKPGLVSTYKNAQKYIQLP